MELPKNITQIGEADKHCRIYVEDYVVSYIKQMNGIAQNKEIAIALYGRKTVEAGVTYLFAYGSAKLNFLQKTVRHLSQAQEQEIEKLRKKYFSEMTFLGYRILNGEMVEGFYICEQDICRCVEGYAQFYEKNDSMLAYMLENREEEAKPEEVDREKYEVVRKRQEERKRQQETGCVTRKPRDEQQPYGEWTVYNEQRQYEDRQQEGRQSYESKYADMNQQSCEGLQMRNARNKEKIKREKDNVIQMPTVGLRRMKMAATGVFVLLCVVALALMQQESTGESLGEAARQAMNNMMEQRLPDAAQEPAANSTLVAEDKLEEALRQENGAVSASGTAGTKETAENAETTESTDAAYPDGNSTNETTEASDNSIAENSTEVTQGATTDTTPANEETDASQTVKAETTESSEVIKAQETAVQPKAYTIQKGDTLIGISLRNYGSNSRVSEICKMNGIKDPDDIKIGQEIFLP
mgnify:CR=1 FL=1